ncbi:MAG: hypothetical protein H7312_04450 [Tardiphaga sp.]|nr:hypothetical protein [Tardiphaga sp.]
MTDDMRELVYRILTLQSQLDDEIETRRKSFGSALHGKAVEFENEIIRQHRQMRQGIGQFLRESDVPSVLVAPICYSMLVPIVLIDLWATIYQHICFRAYRIPRIRRSDHVIIDRHRLQYLNGIEKLNCVYCGYGNGVIGYVRAIAGATEQYWCPIKHALRVTDPHDRYMEFLDYGDAEGYRRRLQQFRDRLTQKLGKAP